MQEQISSGLKMIINLHQVDDIETREEKREHRFVRACLRVAMYSKGAVRDKVIAEACEVLECSPEELEFLMGHTLSVEGENQIFDFPDSERRRQALDAQNLMAAE